jgi:plastocyanin domain-containing protein
MKTLALSIALALVATALPALAHAQPSSQPPKAGAAAPAVRSIELTVTSEGFVPATVHVKKGETVRLVVTRKTDKTCATEIVIKELGVNQKLPLNQAVTVELTPTKAGQLRYACGMDMISGVIVVG